MIICADDYGLHSSVNDAVLHLCEHDKINAVSVLVQGVSAIDAARLFAFYPKIQLGLHLNLLNKNPFRYGLEIKKQIDRFIELFGFFPVYIDGHMHCHIYPPQSAALIRSVSGYKRPASFYIRTVSLHPALKALPVSSRRRLYMNMLGFFGARAKMQMVRAGFKVSGYSWGAFGGHTDPADIFKVADTNQGPADILFTHPGLIADSFALNRRLDFDFLVGLD